jgi:hypothetical protein
MQSLADVGFFTEYGEGSRYRIEEVIENVNDVGRMVRLVNLLYKCNGTINLNNQ